MAPSLRGDSASSLPAADRGTAGTGPARLVASLDVADQARRTEALRNETPEQRVSAGVVPWVRDASEDPARYVARQRSATTWIDAAGVHHALLASPDATQVAVIGERFVGGRATEVETGPEAPTRVSVLVGNDRSLWRSDLPSYSSIRQRGIYPGIDVEFRVGGGAVEKVFTLAPGASVDQVRVELDGVTGLASLDGGELELRTAGGPVRFSAPVAWQGEGAERREVTVRYRPAGLAYGFELGEYDRSRALFIDPVLTSTFVGGNGMEQLRAIALGPDGNVYVTGFTLNYSSTTVSYPTTVAYDGSLNGAEDIVISKFTPDLGTLLASTYVGGNRIDVGRKIAFDAAGNVFVAGETFSTNFPTLGASSWEPAFSGGEYSGMEGFVVKLNASLTTLLGSTYLGGYWWSHASALAVNPADGSVFVAGHDDTSDKASWTPPGRTLPTTGYLKDPITNSSYAYIARFNSALSNMTALTFLYGPRTCTTEGGRDYCPYGGGGVYEILDLGVANGAVYGVGRTGDWTFPTSAGAFDRGYSTGTTVTSKQADTADAVVLRFDLGLTTLQGSTFLGGKLEDYATGLSFDGKGNVIVAGSTYGGYASTALNPEMFPVSAGAFDVTHNGSWDAFVARLDPALTTLQASTFVGGLDGREEWANDVAVAPGATGAYGEGDVFIGGVATGQIPTGVRAFQETAAWELFGSGGWYHTNPYIARLDWKLQRLLAATYLQSGGDGEEIVGIAVTAATPRDVFVTGYASRTDFPVSPGAYDTTFEGGNQDGFVARLPAALAQPGILVKVRGPNAIAPGERGTFTVSYANGLDLIAADVVITANVPAGMNLVDIGNGGMFYAGGGGCAGQVMWRMASLAPTATGALTFTVEVPWGAPDALVEVTARGAASNEATPYFDVAPYIAFVPAAHPTSQDLSGSALTAQFASHAEAKLLLDYARSIGYKFFDSGSLDTLADGTPVLRLYVFAPDGGPATLASSGGRAYLERFRANTYMLMDRTGGFIWDRTKGTLTPFGGWATTTQPSGSLTLALADESDQARWAMAASGFAVSRCRFNCILNSVPEYAVGKLSSIYEAVSAGKDCVVCAQSIKNPPENTEACLKCSSAMSGGVKKAKDLAPVIGDAINWYYIIGNCESDCDKDPNKHICTQDRWECCWTVLSWLGGFDAKCRTACNRTTGTYAPVITDRVNCAYGETCVNGACGAKPKCKGVSCDQKQTRTRVARDPNAKAVSPGGNVLPGETLTYRVDYENVGTGTADGVFILDTLDPDLDASTLALDPKCSYVAANRLVTCTIGTLAAAGQNGSKGSVTFGVKPKSGLAMGTEIVNEAEVHFPSAFEITPTNAVVNRIHGLRADPLSVATLVATPVAVTLRGASAAGGAVSFKVTRPPLNGTLTGSGAALTYTPAANVSGGDDFEYVAVSGTDESQPATVRIVIAPSAAADTTKPAVIAMSPPSGALGIVATTLDVSGTKIYGPAVSATFSEGMDAATLTTATFTLSGVAGQVVYDGTTRTASLLPSAALVANTTYTAAITAGAKDASGNALGATHAWTFKTAGASEPNIAVALPDGGGQPVAVGVSLSNRRKTVAFSNVGTANLTIGNTALSGGDDVAFQISADGCRNRTLAPGAGCSVEVALAGSASPVKTSSLRVASDDPDTPTATVALTTTTAAAPAPYSYYLAEGATSALFDTHIAIANPGSSAATTMLRFLGGDGSLVIADLPVPAFSRRTVNVRDVPGMGRAEFATTVESDSPVVVDRTMLWDPATIYGAHAERSLPGPSQVWYLAEGATHSGFDLFYLLLNPNDSAINVTVRYLLPGGVPPLVKSYYVGPNRRENIWVDLEEVPAGSGLWPLTATDVSAVLTSAGGEPFIVERAMYLSNQGRGFNAGHESAGVTAPAPRWFLAEGATGDLFDLFILVANPNDTATTVRATYLLDDGTTYSKTYAVAGNSRSNIWVDYEEVPPGSGQFPLRSAALSTIVESLDPAVPIIVERAMWWPGTGWYEAHNSPGSTVTGTKWAVADGEASALCDTYILIANTSPFQGEARVTLLYEDGTPSAPLLVTLKPNSRTNVLPEAQVPGSANRRWATLVESVDTGAGLPQIVIERAMYWNGGGVFFAAGSNALGTKLQ
jgi:uncharacterized repeat protein (TIGR01451 family)